MPRDPQYRSKNYLLGALRGLKLAEEIFAKNPDNYLKAIEEKITHLQKHGLSRGDESFGVQLQRQRFLAERIASAAANPPAKKIRDNLDT